MHSLSFMKLAKVIVLRHLKSDSVNDVLMILISKGTEWT